MLARDADRFAGCPGGWVRRRRARRANERSSRDGQRLPRWRASATGPREQPHSPEGPAERA